LSWLLLALQVILSVVLLVADTEQENLGPHPRVGKTLPAVVLGASAADLRTLEHAEI
jgi:hypothetical protein